MTKCVAFTPIDTGAWNGPRLGSRGRDGIRAPVPLPVWQPVTNFFNESLIHWQILRLTRQLILPTDGAPLDRPSVIRTMKRVTLALQAIDVNLSHCSASLFPPSHHKILHLRLALLALPLSHSLFLFSCIRASLVPRLIFIHPLLL
jgi:hypothetical protein